jgi:hypothetical protein
MAGVVPASVEALMQRVLRSFFMTKLKAAVAVLATLGATVTGAGVFAYEPGAPEEVASPALAEPGLETQEGRERPRSEDRIGAGELEEHRARERASVERLSKALDRTSREQLIKALLAPDPKAQILRTLETENLEEHRAKEKAPEEHRAQEKAMEEHRAKEEQRARVEGLEEFRAKERAAGEREARALAEHRARERASIERLGRALDRASREQLIKALLATGPDERLLRILESENLEEHRAKEKALEEHRAK